MRGRCKGRPPVRRVQRMLTLVAAFHGMARASVIRLVIGG